MLRRASNHVHGKRLSSVADRTAQQPPAGSEACAQQAIAGKRFAAVDRGQAGEIILRRRGRHRPLQGFGIPWVTPRTIADPALQCDVDRKEPEPKGLHETADGGYQVEPGPARFRRIGVHATRHTQQTRQMHMQERQVETDEDQPEGGDAQSHHARPPCGVRHPVISRCQHREYEPTDKHVMQVCGYKGGIVCLLVERNDRKHHASQAAQHEDDKKTDYVIHRQREFRSPCPDRTDPGEYLDGSRYRHQHRCGREKAQRHVRNAGGEHVVDPQAEAEKGERHDRGHDGAVPDERCACHDRNDGGQRTGRRQEDDIDFRMAEQPEQVLPEQRRSAEFGLEERPAERAFEFQQDRPEDQRRKAEDHHSCRRQQIPRHDRHSGQRHVRSAELQDSHHDFDRGAHRRNLDEGNAQ